MEVSSGFAQEVETGARFQFGKNWSSFLSSLDDKKIGRAIGALKVALKCDDLNNLSVLDAGSGSGLSSLAAYRLGAKVVSFDFDPESVACTSELKRREGAPDERWKVLHGSVLDSEFLSSLGQFDVVYSWGVLHHTGSMWRAIDLAQERVAPRGRFCLAIYNDQGRWSRGWLHVKRIYNRVPPTFRWMVVWPSMVRLWGPRMLADVMRGRPLETWNSYAENRGMSPWYDAIDWIGGLPFEVATPEAVFEYLKERGFSLVGMKTCGGGKGCNEFTFLKDG